MRFNVVPAVMLAGVLFSLRAQAEEAIRLEQAVRSALDNNERARKTPLRVEQAAGQLDRARGAFFPTLTASGSGQYRLQEDRSGRSTTTSGTLAINQPLISPSAFPSYSQASHQLESEKWGSIQDRRVLAFDTARAFLQALTAERVFEAAARRLDRARANLQNAEARAAAGLASINDATRSSLELATAASAVATAEGRVGTAYLNLGFLMGRRIAPPKDGAAAVLAPPDRTTQAAEGFETNADNQVRAALDRRPDLRAAHERTAALRASAKEPYYRLAPTLSASAQMRVLPDPLPTERGHEETATLNLQWNIFDAGFRYADIRTRTAQAESQALDESLMRRSIDNEIRVALVSLQAAREAFKIADEAIAAAQKSSDETEILYKQGLARAIELTDATARRFDAEVTRASAKLTMEQAYLELRFALGLGPVDDGEGAPK
ncbi:MAG: outer rane efflux protein [Labilithrix sp.]|nr:outer rane efflux protein [Labilithrix sp.]